MIPSNPQTLADILVLSQEMKRSAELFEWGRVQAQDEQRQLLIQTCFPLDDALPDPKRAAEQLRQIIDLDRQVMVMASAAREETGDALSRMNRGRAASQAYEQAGS